MSGHRAAAIRTLVAVAALGVPSCAKPLSNQAPLPPDRPMATAVCEPGKKATASQIVIPDRDGVHLRVSNPSGRDAWVWIGKKKEAMQHRKLVPAGSHVTFHSLIPPGSANVACTFADDAKVDPDLVTRIVVRDYDGWWTSSTLECPPETGGTSQNNDFPGPIDYFREPSAADTEDFIAWFKQNHASVLRSDDKVVPVGYRSIPSSSIAAVRDERTFGVDSYVSVGGSWTMESSYFCDE